MNRLAKNLKLSNVKKTTIINFLYLTRRKLQIHIMGDENWTIHSLKQTFVTTNEIVLYHIQIFYHRLSFEEILPNNHENLLFVLHQFKTRPSTIKKSLSLFSSRKGINCQLINVITCQIHFASV